MPVANGHVRINLTDAPEMRTPTYRRRRAAIQEGIVAAALESPEGRTALAQAMIEPIRIAIEYQAIGRQLMMTDELPQGALARYERDIAVESYAIPRRDPNRLTGNRAVPLINVLNLGGVHISQINLVQWDLSELRSDAIGTQHNGLRRDVFSEAKLGTGDLYRTGGSNYLMRFHSPNGTSHIREFRIHDVEIPWPQGVAEIDHARALMWRSLQIENRFCVETIRSAAEENGTLVSNPVDIPAAIHLGVRELLNEGFLPRHIVCSANTQVEIPTVGSQVTRNPYVRNDELYVIGGGVCRMLVLDPPHIEQRNGISTLLERISAVVNDPVGVRGFRISI